MLSQEFKNCKIYKDKQGANVKLPAFFVRYVDVTQEDRGMGFSEQNYIVEIRHRPGTMPENELNTYLELTGGQVMDLLNVVRDEDTDFSCRALNMQCNIDDGVLIVIASYRLLRTRIVEVRDPSMNELTQNEKVR